MSKALPEGFLRYADPCDQASALTEMDALLALQAAGMAICGDPGHGVGDDGFQVIPDRSAELTSAVYHL